MILYLLRHSYAEKNFSLNDYDRKLTNKGMNHAKQLSQYLSKNKINPDIIYCSSSKRTEETLSLLKTAKNNVHYSKELYHASEYELLKILHKVDDANTSCMLVGHNPSISSIGIYLTSSDVVNLKPCGLLSISFEVDHWAEIIRGIGKFESYYHPSHEV